MTTRTKARLLGLGVALAGLVNVSSALTPALDDRFQTLQELLTPLAANIAAGITAILGIVLVLLGRGIAQRRRFAYHASLIVLAFSTATHLAKGLDIEEAAMTGLLAIALWTQRKRMTVAHDPARWRTLLRAVPVTLVVCYAYGIGGLFVRRGSVQSGLTAWHAFEEVSARLVGITGPLRITGRFGHWFPISLTVLGALSIAALFVFALAPVAERSMGQRDEREEVRTLIERPDGDTLDPFALRGDKSYVFSDDRRAVVAYRYLNGVGLASGDPVGEPERFEDAFSRFLSLCEDKGWRPAVIGARHDRVPMYERFGMRTMYIGDEAIIDVPVFSLEGRKMRNVRQSVAHTQRAGLKTEFHLEGELDPTLRRALLGIAETSRKGAPERGFSMALDALLSGRDSACVVIVCRDEGGSPVAFQRYIPCKRGGALSLDAMRRDPHAPNGVNQRMIVDTVEWARAHGFAEVSLNFSAFRGLIQEGAELSMLQSATAVVLRRLNPYFQLESLRLFNGKFRPRWVPRFVVYRGIGDLPPVGVAALSAESFLPFDRRGDAAKGERPRDEEHEPV